MHVTFTALQEIVGQPKWPDAPRAYVASFGFEDRALAWLARQEGDPNVKKVAFLRYVNAKGKNKVEEARNLAKKAYPRASISEIPYMLSKESLLEKRIFDTVANDFRNVEEIILDISSQTKLLILLWLVIALQAGKRVRVVYCEATHYPPTKEQFEKVRSSKGTHRLAALTGFPTMGARSLVRAHSLSSIRMQGQPTALIAFTSFNEELIRHVMGSINPHRMLLINGLPPNESLCWRAYATQELHSRIIEEYPADNAIDSVTNLLERTVSTLNPSETVECLEKIYELHGRLERIIAVGTGSKMQTVGLAIFRSRHPDVHVEYVTPDSYLFPGTPTGIGVIHSNEISRIT